MKSTDLHMFFSLGIALERLSRELSGGMKGVDLFPWLIDPNNCLLAFLSSTEDMPLKDARREAEYIRKWVSEMFRSIQLDPTREINQEEASMYWHKRQEFEHAFEREYRNLDVFTVMKKGIYDTRALFERPEEKFPSNIRAVLPKQMVYDLKQAGKCLAFEIPTACAFHICRGTEALILDYYAVLAGHPYPSSFPKNWKRYAEELVKLKAPKRLTDRLDEIRDTDRNPYTHPEQNVTLEEAPLLFELCTGVIFLIAQEMSRNTP